MSDLEELFTFVRRAIGPDGVFVISDMIGRNGHQRWPEAKRLAERLFSKLPSVLGAAPRDFVLGLVSLINSLTSGKIQCHARSVRGSLLRTRCSVFDQ